MQSWTDFYFQSWLQEVTEILLNLNFGKINFTTTTSALHCRHPAAGFGLLLGGGAQEARGRGQPLHCSGRHPAAGPGRLLGGGAQEACWRGQHRVIKLLKSTP